MRSFLAAALLGLAALTFAPQEAQAQRWGRGGFRSSFGAPYRSYYGAPYRPYGTGFSFNSPGLSFSYGPQYYTPPYYWSGRYNYTPYGRNYSYGAYSPWTNQYRYRYGYGPRR